MANSGSAESVVGVSADGVVLPESGVMKECAVFSVRSRVDVLTISGH